jgi:alkylation response protein AidB-like acyl-CoA dehydrogenase
VPGVLQAALDATVDYEDPQAVRHADQRAFKRCSADGRHADASSSPLDGDLHLALRAGSADLAERHKALSAAKVIIGQACRFVGQQAVQLHGGMGVTDELWVSHAFKRLAAIELSLPATWAPPPERFVALSQSTG